MWLEMIPTVFWVLKLRLRLTIEGATGKAFINVTLDKSVSTVSVQNDIIKVRICPFLVMPYLQNFDCIPVSTLSAKTTVSANLSYMTTPV